MKIGILTYHFANNLGAMIQAYALRKAIQKIVSQDDTVEIINYIPAAYRDNEEDILNPKYVSQRNKNMRFLMKECGIISKVSTDIYQFQKYDIYIVGSDQVWNPNLPVFEETSEYFLDFVQKDKIKAAYAASIGEKIDESFNIDLFKKNLPQFNYLSVREQSYIPFVEKMAGKRCYGVLDPSMLLSKNDYCTLINKECNNKICENDYILAISYNLNSKRRMYDFANRYSIKNKLEVHSMEKEVSPYFFLREEKSIYYYGIEEKLNEVRNAKMVFTDSFHFMAISIIMHVPFYVMLAKRVSRIVDLLNYLKLESRIITDTTKLNDLNENIDFEEVDKLLETKREFSFEYLKNIVYKGEE